VTPARNVEIKARVADPSALRARVAAAASAPPVIIGQRDTFFAVARGTTVTHIPWAQRLPVASLAADLVDTDGRRGRLLVWHHLPSVYAGWRDADGRWWFGHWMDDPDLRVPADGP
jgi:hypothetical protein